MERKLFRDWGSLYLCQRQLLIRKSGDDVAERWDVRRM